MAVSVITPPDPIVVPSDIAGSHAPNDATIAALIQAATEEIDGPSGWVGRCFGPQELELTSDRWPDFVRLPYPPFIELVSVKWINGVGAAQTWVAGGSPFSVLTPPATRGQAGDVVIRYRAGYDEAKTGKVPERARQAVILGVRALMGLIEQRMLRSSQVEGVGTRSFVGADVASAALRTASERLLSTLRVYG